MTEARRYVLTAEEHGLLRDAETADQLEAAAKQVRARWIAEALERLALDLASEQERQQSTTWDSLRYAATLTVRRADQYRAGTR